MAMAAVEVRRGSKSYKDLRGRGIPVLKNVDLRVDYGSIYSLLGASGCGKTTLLSCLIGLQNLDSGWLSVFGGVPGDKDLGIPGPRLGYMPQENSLSPIFNVKETLYYYGKIYGMSNSEITARTSVMMNVLDLPEEHKLAKNLSGGQARRLSLAIALIHQPALLILDEPTVGLDPLLRLGISTHLKDLVVKDNTTIIITTHYIEESRFSDKVGILRDGRIIAEEPPLSLIAKYGALTLDEAVLRLCHQDRRNSEFLQNPNEKLVEPNNNPLVSSPQKVECLGWERMDTLRSFKQQEKIPVRGFNKPKGTDAVLAVLLRKLLTEIRFWPLFVIQMILPIIETFVIQNIIGVTPTGLVMTYASQDWDTHNTRNVDDLYTYCNTVYGGKRLTCLEDELSSICAFINQFDSGQLQWVRVPSKEAGVEMVHMGKAFGVLQFPDNFTYYMKERLFYGMFADNATIDGAEMNLRIDMADKMQTFYVLTSFIESVLGFLKTCVVSQGMPAAISSLPIQYHAVYGDVKNKDGWRIATHPHTIMLFMYVLSNLAGLVYALEKRWGLTKRDAVAGLKFRYFITASFIVESVIMVMQITLFFFMLSTFYGMKMEGSYALAFVLVYVFALSGWFLGITLALFLDNESQGYAPLLLINVGNIFNTGVLWPLEAIPHWYRVLSIITPATAPTLAMHDIMFRGKGLEHPQVRQGFIFPFAFMAFFMLVMILKKNKT